MESTRRPWELDLLPELGLVAGGFVGYLLVRWHTLDRTEDAVANARGVLALEDALALDQEYGIQSATFTSAPWLGHAATHVYVWGYLPVLVAATVWLYLRHRESYRTLRTALLVSGSLGLLVYALYPVAPPWISDDRFTDTVTEASLEGFARPAGVMNELGAIPSFHCGWLTIAAVVVFSVTRSRLVRVLCVVYPAIMFFSVVVTGNHWIIDIPAGLGLAALGVFVASRQAAARHPVAAAAPG